MPITPQLILLALVLPLVLSGGLWLLWAWYGREGKRPAAAGVIGLLALPAAFAAAFYANDQRGTFPPANNVEWLFYLAPVVVLLAAPEGWLWAILRPVCWAVLLAVFIGLVSQNHVKNSEDPKAQVYLSLAAWLVGGLVLRAGAGRAVHAAPKTGVVILGMSTAILAALSGLHGSQVFPFRAGALALALLPLLGVLFVVNKERRVPPAALTAWMVLFTGTALAMWLYSDKFPLLEIGLAAIGPVLAAAVPTKLDRWKGTMLRLAVGVIPPAIALGLAVMTFMKEADNPYGY